MSKDYDFQFAYVKREEKRKEALKEEAKKESLKEMTFAITNVTDAQQVIIEAMKYIALKKSVSTSAVLFSEAVISGCEQAATLDSPNADFQLKIANKFKRTLIGQIRQSTF